MPEWSWMTHIPSSTAHHHSLRGVYWFVWGLMKTPSRSETRCTVCQNSILGLPGAYRSGSFWAHSFNATVPDNLLQLHDVCVFVDLQNLDLAMGRLVRSREEGFADMLCAPAPVAPAVSVRLLAGVAGFGLRRALFPKRLLAAASSPGWRRRRSCSHSLDVFPIPVRRGSVWRPASSALLPMLWLGCWSRAGLRGHRSPSCRPDSAR